MGFEIPNIYRSRYSRFLILVPLALLFVSLFLARGITLDSTLSGGESILIQTNTTLSPQQLSGMIAGALHTAAPSITKGTGTLQITIASNSSISQAYTDLASFYTYRNYYDSYNLNYTTIKIGLGENPSNSTLAKELNYTESNMSEYMALMNKSLVSELSLLSPFVGNRKFIPNDTSNMTEVASSAYTDAGLIYENRTISALHTLVPFTTYTYQEITASESSQFLGQLEEIMIVAFVLISIAVFFIVRSLGPSFAVIFGAANDIIVALGAMSLFGIPLGTASIGGLLMLLGYSIDTDVLTAIRILKRHEGTPEDRAYASMKTGITMTTAAIVSFAILFTVSVILYVPSYYEISGAVLFGLIGDIFTTWLGNASIILFYARRKSGG